MVISDDVCWLELSENVSWGYLHRSPMIEFCWWLNPTSLFAWSIIWWVYNATTKRFLLLVKNPASSLSQSKCQKNVQNRKNFITNPYWLILLLLYVILSNYPYFTILNSYWTRWSPHFSWTKYLPKNRGPPLRTLATWAGDFGHTELLLAKRKVMLAKPF